MVVILHAGHGDEAETVGLDFQGDVNEVIEVLDGVEDGDLDDFPFVEVFAQPLEGFVRDALMFGGFAGVVDCGAVAFGEEGAGFVLGECAELVEVEFFAWRRRRGRCRCRRRIC